mmetsp:Transcript_23072/g.65616  ORF Transcript_23072/g.65616 Transcript_23072/m.65616 type:complete len:287 (+) Transcript_23072:261-1121(+)
MLSLRGGARRTDAGPRRSEAVAEAAAPRAGRHVARRPVLRGLARRGHAQQDLEALRRKPGVVPAQHVPGELADAGAQPRLGAVLEEEDSLVEVEPPAAAVLAAAYVVQRGHAVCALRVQVRASTQEFRADRHEVVPPYRGAGPEVHDRIALEVHRVHVGARLQEQRTQQVWLGRLDRRLKQDPGAEGRSILVIRDVRILGIVVCTCAGGTPVDRAGDVALPRHDFSSLVSHRGLEPSRGQVVWRGRLVASFAADAGHKLPVHKRRPQLQPPQLLRKKPRQFRRRAP